MSQVLLTGATGLVGGHLLRLLQNEPSISTIAAPTRRPLATLCHRRQTDWQRSKKRSSTSRGSCRGWKPVWPGWKAEPTIWFQKALRRLF